MSVKQGYSPKNRTPALGSGIVTGTKTVTTAGTALRITASSTPCLGVYVSCDIGTGSISAVGDSAVKAANNSQQGIVIVPGNSATFIAVNNLNLLWVDAQANGAKI